MRLRIPEPTELPTPRQLRLLKEIASFRANQCCSPTIAELASEVGTSRSTAFEHIAELRRKDLLSASAGKARSLKLTSKALELLSRLDDTDPGLSAGSQMGMPLVGTVAAGAPIEAVEDKDCLSLSSHFGSGDDLFALAVKGDSMLDDDIRSGDYIICRRSSLADDGQLVVAILENENATLKRFYKEKTRVRLQPANDRYQPIYSDNCRIEAVVIGLIRKF